MSTVVTILWEFSDLISYLFDFFLLILFAFFILFSLFLIILIVYKIFSFYFGLKFKPRKFEFKKGLYILGHRGIPVLAHENSLASFELIKKFDIDGTEFDVNISTDKELFVYHDYSLFRLFGINKELTTLTSEQINKIKITPFPKINDYLENKLQENDSNEEEYNSIPTLKMAFEKLKDCRLINLEIKSNSLKNLGLEKKVADLIKDYGLVKNIVISSFDPFSLYRFSKYLPDVPRGLLISKGGLPIYLKKLWFLNFSKADFIHFEAPFIGTKLVKKLSKKGYQIVFWGINSVQLFNRALKEKPIFIISDIPHILKKYYESNS